MPFSCITDVFGDAGTGKTQFAFQNAVMVSQFLQDSVKPGPKVIFVDCAGSFRPERIVEIADNRTFNAGKILEGIYSISVRSVYEQMRASRRIESESFFSDCRLLVVDDVTNNFVSDFSEESEIVERQRLLSLYTRRLSYIANNRGISILCTNSARSRGDLGEGETTGEILSTYSLYRLHFTRKDRERYATKIEPDLSNPRIKFEIQSAGIS